MMLYTSISIRLWTMQAMLLFTLYFPTVGAYCPHSPAASLYSNSNGGQGYRMKVARCAGGRLVAEVHRQEPHEEVAGDDHHEQQQRVERPAHHDRQRRGQRGTGVEQQPGCQEPDAEIIDRALDA